VERIGERDEHKDGKSFALSGPSAVFLDELVGFRDLLKHFSKP
jgi:hypothetical protein